MTIIDAYTDKGNSILELSNEQKVILVFLRHFGCNFCRETLMEISKIKGELDKTSRMILVHQSSRSYANEILKIYELETLEHVSDSGHVLYNSFGLGKMRLIHLFNPSVIIGTFKSILKGHFPGKPVGCPYQLPGIFILKNKKLIDSYRYRNIAQVPPFLKLAS